jgi:cell division protein FtsX
MDAKTLEKMTVVKLREEAMKFDDISGVHGMHKAELISALKEKFGIVEDKTDSELLVEQKHAIKQKIQQLKAEKDQAIEAKDEKKTVLIRRRLRRQRRLLKKVLTKTAA